MSVDIKHLDICIAEAKRFLDRAKACLHDLEQTKANYSHKDYDWRNQHLSAAVKRSSMDLSRALIALRDHKNRKW